MNIFQQCLVYLLGCFETRPDRVTLVPLGAIGFDGLIVVDEVTCFANWQFAVVRHFLVNLWWLV